MGIGRVEIRIFLARIFFRGCGLGDVDGLNGFRGLEMMIGISGLCGEGRK